MMIGIRGFGEGCCVLCGFWVVWRVFFFSPYPLGTRCAVCGAVYLCWLEAGVLLFGFNRGGIYGYGVVWWWYLVRFFCSDGFSFSFNPLLMEG